MSATAAHAAPRDPGSAQTARASRHPGLSGARTSGAPLPGTAQRVAFVGAQAWLDLCTPDALAHGFETARFEAGPAPDVPATLAALSAFAPEATVVFDPWTVPGDLLEALAECTATLGILVDGLPLPPNQRGEGGDARADLVSELDRLVTFDPALTGERVGSSTIWRAIPPPVADALFGEVRALHGAPRVMSLGRATEYRDTILTPTKHAHDLLELIHGVTGEQLVELLGEYDVGVYVPRERRGGFGHQAAMHLAAGQLLLTGTLVPAHGLEREIDYLQVESPDELVRVLDRMGRFPEMHQRVRVRGRLKAELFRASRLFGRIIHDLRADVAAFGGSAGRRAPTRLNASGS
jgi:hypothetical protein